MYGGCSYSIEGEEIIILKTLLKSAKPLNKNQKIGLYISLICIIGIYLFYTYPRPINITYSAIEYQIGNPQIEKPVKINIDGFYYNKILSKDTFGGTVTINGKEFRAYNLSINENGQILSCANNSGLTSSYGTIFASKKLASLTICIFNNGGWNSGDGFNLSAPCKSRAEAVTISNRLLSDLIRNKIK